MSRLRRMIPGLPRNSVAAYVRRWRRVSKRRRQRRWCRLQWNVPGAVWALDGTWLDRPVQGGSRRALVVAELCSKQTLCLQSVPGERAVAAERVLQELIERHGAPLVLKVDNGSAFVAKRFEAFCRGYGITLLHSPVRRPRWNGTCEVSGRWAKQRAYAAAARRVAEAALCQADLDAAVTFQGIMQRVAPELRHDFQRVVAEQIAVLAAERGLAKDAVPQDHRGRSLRRVAVRRALEMCHILTIEGREYRQWLHASAA